MPETAITFPGSGQILEGPPGSSATLQISLANVGYAYEKPRTLKYTASRDFYDQSAWRWHGGTQEIGPCGYEYERPPVSERTLISGEVVFEPFLSLLFLRDIPGPLANGLRDPLRFVTISIRNTPSENC